MPKISEERLAKYRELGKKDLWDFDEPKASAIFIRMEEEGCTPNDYAFNPHMGMFHAPLTQDLTDVDIAFVGVGMENTVPERTGQKYGPAAVRKWSHNMGPIHHMTNIVPFDMTSIIDYGNVDFSNGMDVKNKIDRAFSKTYGLYMPFWMAFTYNGYGIHELPEWPGGYKEGEDHLGIPVSHGCVRLGVNSAEQIYNWSEVGTPVIVQE